MKTLPAKETVPARRPKADNKHNIEYFEASSMKCLHDELSKWQRKNRKRFLSLNIQWEGEQFVCIALTNPTEVIIMDGSRDDGVDVTDKALRVCIP